MNTQRILLLGCGYTLEKTIFKLQPEFKLDDILVTTTTAEKKKRFEMSGVTAELVTTSENSEIKSLFERYPYLENIVDSIPPFREENRPERGVENVASELHLLPRLKLMLYLSTTGVYGVNDGSIVDEDTPTGEQLTPWGRARVLSENAYTKHLKKTKNNVTFCTLRLPAIYGEKRGMKQALQSGYFKLVMKKNAVKPLDVATIIHENNLFRWSNRVHVEDLASIIACIVKKAVLNDMHIPKKLCIADDTPSLQNEIVLYFCQKYGYPLPDCITEEEARERGYFTMVSNQKVSNKKMKEILGYELLYPSYHEE
jgi:nucleoside-diphosphate-sugar epimerase